MNKDNKQYLLFTIDDNEFITYKNNNYVFPSYESILKAIKKIEIFVNEDREFSEYKIGKYKIYELNNTINVETQPDKPRILIKIVK